MLRSICLLSRRCNVIAEQQPYQIGADCLRQLLALQQAAPSSPSTCNRSSSSTPSLPAQWQCVRGMAGRTHKLSLKRANNKASWLAVAPYLEQQEGDQQQGDTARQQQQPSAVLQTAITPLPVLEEPVLYQRIGRITGPYSVGAQPCFAVMESGGAQWKVTADDVIYHNKIPGAVVNDVLEFNKVLLVGTQQETTIGRPFIPGASVVAAVEEVFKDAKVYVFKKKPRKRYSKLKGHRSHITALRILEVRQPTGESAAAAEAALSAATVTNVRALRPGSREALQAHGLRLPPQQLKQQRRKQHGLSSLPSPQQQQQPQPPAGVS